ncbi:ABC transporter permease [bacterium]|nr:ABC transporter permease [bacterium]
MKWWGLPAKVWMTCFILLPFVWLVVLSLQTSYTASPPTKLDFHQFNRALTHPYRGIIRDSLLMSFAAALAVLMISVPVTWLISRLPRAKRNLWLAFFTIPLGLNFVVRIYAWFVLLRPEGLLTVFLGRFGFAIPLVSSQFGVFLGLVYGYLPVIFLPLYSVFERLENSHIEAAQDLGASSWQRWRDVIIPETQSGLLASFLFVFVPMLGEYLIPRMIGGGLVATLGTQIESQFLGSGRPNWPFGAALSICLLLSAACILVICFKILSRSTAERQTGWSISHIV